jgi:hypothetical protein
MNAVNIFVLYIFSWMKTRRYTVLLNCLVEWLGMGIDIPDARMVYQNKQQQQEFRGFQSSVMEEDGHLQCDVKHRACCFRHVKEILP